MSTKRSTRMMGIVAGAGALALVAAACGGGSGDGDGGSSELDPNADLSKQSLVVSNWDEYMPEDVPANFETETGAKVTINHHATNEDVMGKITAGGDSGLDVAFVSGQFAQALAEQGLIMELDHDLIPNLKNLYPEATELAFDPGNKFSVPYTWGTTGLCYRSDLVETEPTKWEDLLKPADDVKGKTTMLSTDRWMLLPAQKMLGFSANTTDDAELEQVKEQLLETKPTLLAFDDTIFYEKLISGEAVLTQAWDGWCNYGIAENQDIKWAVPEEGSDLWSDTMVILNTSKNKEAAHAFINYILEPEVHSWAAENILYLVPNKAAMESLNMDDFAIYPNFQMTPADLAQGEELMDLGESTTKFVDIATEVRAS